MVFVCILRASGFLFHPEAFEHIQDTRGGVPHAKLLLHISTYLLKALGFILTELCIKLVELLFGELSFCALIRIGEQTFDAFASVFVPEFFAGTPL